MVMRKLVDAVIAGVGLSAGSELFEKAKAALDEPDEVRETPAERKAREKAEAKALEAVSRAQEKAAREKAAAQAKTAREIESELAALKKRMTAAPKKK